MKGSSKSTVINCLLLLALLQARAYLASVAITVNPSGRKISAGGLISVQCSLTDVSGSGGSLVWYRRQGDVSFKLGTDDLLTLNDGDVTNNRYTLAQVRTSDKSKVYKLTLNDAKQEDTATIECRLSTGLSTAAAASISIAVCADTSSTFCNCMLSQGWASPECFTDNLDESLTEAAESGRKTVVGLIIALVVIFAYTVVLVLIGKREKISQCCTEEPSEEEQMLRGKPEYDDSVPAQVDINDSASDSATCSTSDPSSSDSQGSTQSASSSQRIYQGPPPKVENWSSRKKTQVDETSFVLKPEIHYNQGYVSAHDDGAKSICHREYSKDEIPLPAAESSATVAPIPIHRMPGGYPDDPSQYSATFDSHMSDNRSGISTISGHVNTHQNQNLGIYPSLSLLDIAGTDI